MSSFKTLTEREQLGPYQKVMAGIWRPTLTDWRGSIEDYIYLSRKRFNNKFSMFKLQFELLHDIYTEQNSIKILKDLISNPHKIKDYNSEIDVLTEHDIKYFNSQLNEARFILKALKDIADGHLWRMFNYKRPLLYNLAIYPSPGAIVIDDGFLGELQNWGNSILRSDVTHFILNDISNFARLGDVILRYSNGQVEVKEIKTGEKKQKGARLTRQKEKREQFISLANTGEAFIRGHRVKILNSPILYKTSLEIVKDTLEKSESSGISTQQINSYLTVKCFDLSKLSSARLEKEHPSFPNYQDDSLGSNDRVLKLSLLEFRSRGFSPSITPICIYPFSEGVIADLLTSQRDIVYLFDYEEFFNVLSQHDCEIVSNFFENLTTKRGQPAGPFCQIKFKEVTISIPFNIISQIIFETMDVSSLIKLLAIAYDNKISGEFSYSIAFEGEENLWK